VFTWLKRLTGTPRQGSGQANGDAENTASLRQIALARRYLALARSGALRARYDAAVTTENNRRHWTHADALSADAAASAAVLVAAWLLAWMRQDEYTIRLYRLPRQAGCGRCRASAEVGGVKHRATQRTTNCDRKRHNTAGKGCHTPPPGRSRLR